MNPCRFDIEPPYWAVIFASCRKAGDAGYAAMAARMMEAAAGMPGFLGVDAAGGEDGRLGITVSYWRDKDSIAAWKNHAEHKIAQELGKSRWYDNYSLRAVKVERAEFGP
jgi:heme-degrading monooxygenase HmoA